MPKKPEVVANKQYGGAYKDKLEDAEKTGQCIFCQKRIQQGNFLCRMTEWLLRYNEFPTKDQEGKDPEHHFLIISRTHRPNDCIDFSPADWHDIQELVHWARRTYDITGGGLVHRIGDPIRSGATILHAHIHFVVPRVVEVDGKPKTIPVYMPIG